MISPSPHIKYLEVTVTPQRIQGTDLDTGKLAYLES